MERRVAEMTTFHITIKLFTTSSTSTTFTTHSHLHKYEYRPLGFSSKQKQNTWNREVKFKFVLKFEKKKMCQKMLNFILIYFFEKKSKIVIYTFLLRQVFCLQIKEKILNY